MLKRVLDLSAAVMGLTLLLPVIAGVAILIRVSMGSPIFFRQMRPGLNGRLFMLFKFRTMSLMQDAKGIELPDGMRLTKVGSFLRKSSIDEIPQLINVLIGDMSLVGPRPLLIEYLPLYSVEQAKRHLVRPGITGLAQVRGRNTLSWQERFKIDIWYVENVSLVLDVKILGMTILKVLRRDGINASGADTMEKFTGN